MRFSRLLQVALVLALCAGEGASQARQPKEGARDPQQSCAHVLGIFPAMLRELRATFNGVKEYFQMKDDDLGTILLRDELLEDFKGSQGCYSVTEMIRFYMDDVLPKANSNNSTIRQTVIFMGNTLAELKHTLKRCHRFLACEKRKTVQQIKETYSKMQDNGIYKAMGEFDIFIDYIEEYLNAKKKK